MRSYSGFTLLETLFALTILSGALIAVASVFSVSIATNATNQQRTIATLLLCQKLEQFQTASLSDPAWQPGGSLDVMAPGAGYFDIPGVSYERLWQVSTGAPRTVTVVLAVSRGQGAPYVELIRATTAQATTF